MSHLQQFRLGRNKVHPDNEITKIPLNFVHSIGIISDVQHDSHVAGFIVNGKRYERNTSGKTEATEILELDADEYIDYLDIDFISKETHLMGCCRIATNLGRMIHSPLCDSSTPRTNQQTFKYIRMFGLGAEIASQKRLRVRKSFIETLELKYQSNYRKPSSIAIGESKAIIGITTQFSVFTKFTTAYTDKLFASTKMIKSQFRASVTAKASEKSLAYSASVSSTMGFEASSERDIHKKFETNQTASTNTTIAVEEGTVGLEIVKVDVIHEADGTSWMRPSGNIEFITHKVDQDLDESIYDLTGLLSMQVPSLASRETTKNGVSWYKV